MSGDVPNSKVDQDLDELPLRLVLMQDFMNEQYAAARHHQSIRLPMLALVASAAGLLFAEGLKMTRGIAPDPIAGLFIGMAILALGSFAWKANRLSHFNNRLHSETATQCRKIIARYISEPEDRQPLDRQRADPIWIRKAVEKAIELSENPKEEDILKFAGLALQGDHLVPLSEKSEGAADPADQADSDSKKDLAGKKSQEQESRKIGKELTRALDRVPQFIWAAGLVLLLLNVVTLVSRVSDGVWPYWPGSGNRASDPIRG